MPQLASTTALTDHQQTTRRRILLTLCVTEITSWGILYYAFTVLALPIAADTGWSPNQVTAAFTLGQLTAALTGIPVGRWLDRLGPHRIMTAGSILAVPALATIALAPTLPVFYLGWLAAGFAMGAVLYPPAFATLTRWYGADAVKALMILTLAAGLASTVFAPTTALLLEAGDWRSTYLILAAVLAAVTIPAHHWGLRGHWPEPPAASSPAAASHQQIVRSRAYLCLVVAMSLAAFAAFAGVFNLVPLLLENGFSPTLAAVTLGLGGLGQVLGRLGYLPLAAHSGTAFRTLVVIAASAATTALLGLATTVTALISIAIGAGLIRGIFTLVQATAITERWGATFYGRLNGLMSAPIVIVMAFAPWAGTVLADWTGSYANTYLVLAGVAALAAAVAAGSMPARS